MSNSTTIATSIAPFNIEVQCQAVQSWLDLGFKVVSVNVPEEIRQLAGIFNGVDFQPVHRDARNLAGKPYVYFDDVLSALRSTNSDFLGILNSDIHMKAPGDFRARIEALASDSLVFAVRQEVETVSGPILKENTFGVDAFFFPKYVADIFSASPFCLGMPWWDTWALWYPLLYGVPLKHIVDPVAIHVDHPSRWSHYYSLFGEELFLGLRQLAQRQGVDFLLPAHRGKPYRDKDYAYFALVILSYALGRAQKIQLYPQATGSDFHRLSTEFVAMSAQLQELLDHSTKSAELLEKQLLEVTESFSWKLTRPLRWLKKVLLSGR